MPSDYIIHLVSNLKTCKTEVFGAGQRRKGIQKTISEFRKEVLIHKNKKYGARKDALGGAIITLE